MSGNTITKNQPLHISIQNLPNGWLSIRNNIQPKLGCCDELEENLKNIANKYKLLCGKDIRIRMGSDERIITIPLIESKSAQPV
jgi:hypothetical protein